MHQVKQTDPLYEQVFRKLEQEILNGEIPSGERLIDTKIASEFGISRGPVREAFRKLERDGLIINSKGNVTVYNPSLQDALELYQVRVGLESVATFWATQNITQDGLKQIKELLIQTERAIELKKVDDIIVLNTKFHDLIISFSENSRLETMMNNIRSLIQLCRKTTLKEYNRSDSFYIEHFAVFKAMSVGEPELAAKRMEQHISNDMNHFKESYLKKNLRQTKHN